MRSETPGRGWSLTIVILVVNVLVFFVEHANGVESRSAFREYGALSLEGVKRGFVWQFLTFQFLHGGLPHLLLNSLGLYFFGRPLEGLLGKRTFLKLYLWSGLAGGVFQVLLALLSSRFGGPMVGASAGICGLVAAFALLYPDSSIYLFFVLPVRAKYLLPLMIALPAVFLFTSTDSGIAHGAHLGGTLLGFAYIRWFYEAGRLGEFWQRLRGPRRSRPLVKVRFPKAASWQEEKGASPKTSGPTDFISKEVDPILEKISAHGFQSLTEREKKILETARARLDKR